MNCKEVLIKIKNKYKSLKDIQKRILLIIILGIIVLISGVSIFCSTVKISKVRLESVLIEKGSFLGALDYSAHKGVIKANGYADFKFSDSQRKLFQKVSEERGTCALTIRLKMEPTASQKELFYEGSVLPFKFGFLWDEDFSLKGKFISDIYTLNKKITVQANEALAPDLFDVSIAVGKNELSAGKLPEGFFVYSTIKCRIIEACVVPAEMGFDVLTQVPFYGFASNGGIIDFTNSTFDFSGGSLIFSTQNNNRTRMPEYSVFFSDDDEKKSNLDNIVKVELNTGGEKYFLNNVKAARQISIPSAAIKDSFSRFEVKTNKECIKGIVLKEGKKNPSGVDILTPIKTDPGLILKYKPSMWRTLDYEVFEWDRYPGILFFDIRNLEKQDKFFQRLAFYVEKEGYKGRLWTNEQLAGKHAYNAHDYSAASMADFFNKATETGFILNPEEELLKRILIHNGLLEPDGDFVKANEGGLVSISQETNDWSRGRLLAHEGWHTLYFRYPDFRNYVAAVYYTMDEKSLSFLLDYFKSQPSLGYDQTDDYLIKNEFMAYIMQQPLSGVGENFVNWANWGTVKKYTPELAEYVKNTKGRGFEDAAVILNDFVFDNYGIVCGNIALINR